MYKYVDKYSVKPGETLYSIANNTQFFTVRQIMFVNPQIKNPDLIYSGQIINIPQMIPMSIYTVKLGDTLGTIIYNYNQELLKYYGFQITYDEVFAYNPQIINPNLIFPGMRIALPEIL